MLTDSRGAGYSYTYDAAGRTASMSINSVLQGTYKYDFAGRQAIRIMTSPAITIHSVFDSQGRRIAEYNQATGALIREYVWLNWEPIAVIEGGVTSFVRTDHIGRPVFATNTAGTEGLDRQPATGRLQPMSFVQKKPAPHSPANPPPHDQPLTIPECAALTP